MVLGGKGVRFTVGATSTKSGTLAGSKDSDGPSFFLEASESSEKQLTASCSLSSVSSSDDVGSVVAVERRHSSTWGSCLKASMSKTLKIDSGFEHEQVVLVDTSEHAVHKVSGGSGGGRGPGCKIPGFLHRPRENPNRRHCYLRHR